ncbi:mgmt family protein [gamma proteobacterium HTCC5015]|nr:mgmt family protein [gamma proteobacterium HTCC5015]
MATELQRAIQAVVKEVPVGRVATYGQIARLAGYPGRSRSVSPAMGAAPKSMGLPWWRIINAQGKSSIRGEGVRRQLDLLAEEGVESLHGRIDLSRYQWDPVLDGMMADFMAPPFHP